MTIQQKSNNRWYNSPFGEALGIGIAALGIGAGLAGFCKVYYTDTRDVGVYREADLNGNGEPEKFYFVDGKVAIVEIDGYPVMSQYEYYRLKLESEDK